MSIIETLELASPARAARHLVVTCGVSQIDSEKKAIVPELILRKAWMADASPAPYPKDVTQDCDVSDLVSRLKEKASSLKGYVSRSTASPETPFGAEISTLEAMRSAGDFVPNDDHVTLLHSDTRKGRFCADVINSFLVGEWQMRAERVKVSCIEGLTDSWADTSRIVSSLLEGVEGALNDVANTNACLVISGGYKGTLPFVTAYALVRGIPMYYLFDGASQVSKFDFDNSDAIRRNPLSPNWLEAFKRIVDPRRSIGPGSSVSIGINFIEHSD